VLIYYDYNKSTMEYVQLVNYYSSLSEYVRKPSHNYDNMYACPTHIYYEVTL
jgi:hypothetical protein